MKITRPSIALVTALTVSASGIFWATPLTAATLPTVITNKGQEAGETAKEKAKERKEEAKEKAKERKEEAKDKAKEKKEEAMRKAKEKKDKKEEELKSKAEEKINDHVDKRQENQDKRIDQGVSTGKLTPEELARLETQQQAIEALQNKISADGKVTKAEAKEIIAALNEASRSIYGEKHDAEGKVTSEQRKKLESGQLSRGDAKKLLETAHKNIEARKKVKEDAPANKGSEKTSEEKSYDALGGLAF